MDYLVINVFCLAYHKSWLGIWGGVTIIMFTFMFLLDRAYETNSMILSQVMDYSSMASFTFAIIYWNRYAMT